MAQVPGSTISKNGIMDSAGSLSPTQKRAYFAYSKESRRRSVKAPDEGPFVKVRSVFDICKQVRGFVEMVSNVWSWTAATTTPFRMSLPGLVRVSVGIETFAVPGFLLQELENAADAPLFVPPWPTKASPSTPMSSGGYPSVTSSVSSSRVQDVRIQYSTPYFSQILLLVKMRWLLRLHCACCELDYRVCSLKNIILGMQFVVLQQYGDAECDNIFDTKVSQHIGSFLNLDSMFDDIVDQLHRSLGTSWRPFLDFVASCDPTKAVHASLIDSMRTPKVVPTDGLAVVIDTIFLANFLRQSMNCRASRLRDFHEDCRQFGIAALDFPPLHGARDLLAWATARTKPTLANRSKVGKNETEKLAQLDAVLLAAALELASPEIIASASEVAESKELSDEMSMLTSSLTDGHRGKRPSSPDSPGSTAGGPVGGRAIPRDRPVPAVAILEAAMGCIHHHDTFPIGIRERLYRILTEEFFLTRAQMQSLATASTQNIDGKRLSHSVLLHMVDTEKSRLRQYRCDYFVDTSHCTAPPLVQSLSEHGKSPKYLKHPSLDITVGCCRPRARPNSAPASTGQRRRP